MVCEASKILGLGQEISSHWGKTHNNLKLVFKMQPRLERVELNKSAHALQVVLCF